jgi:hypothetical protein
MDNALEEIWEGSCRQDKNKEDRQVFRLEYKASILQMFLADAGPKDPAVCVPPTRGKNGKM